jgi:outer membrane murein-binding lipoprotein Lpp
MRLIKLVTLILAILHLTGCASLCDVNNIQNQIYSLKEHVTVLQADVAIAKEEAGKAAIMSANAETAANTALASIKETNYRLFGKGHGHKGHRHLHRKKHRRVHHR